MADCRCRVARGGCLSPKTPGAAMHTGAKVRRLNFSVQPSVRWSVAHSTQGSMQRCCGTLHTLPTQPRTHVCEVVQAAQRAAHVRQRQRLALRSAPVALAERELGATCGVDAIGTAPSACRMVVGPRLQRCEGRKPCLPNPHGHAGRRKRRGPGVMNAPVHAAA